MTALRRVSVSFLIATIVGLVPVMGTGVMIPKPPDVPPLAIKSHRVKVEVGDQVARTHVEEVFVNSTDRQLEATFVFPLPAGASVSEFAMMMNGKRVTGEVLEKNKAREIYTDIVRRMQDPGLLEYLGSNLFKASVFPIPPRGEQKVELAYSQVVKMESGLAEFVYPLKTGEKASSTVSDFSVVVQISSKVALKTVYSPTHKIDVVRKSDNQVVVSFEEPKGSLDRDFRLLYTVSDKDLGLNLVANRSKGKDGYFLMMIAPKVELKEEEILPKDVCFVMDTSGSMSGQKMDQARQALRYCVSNLGKRDRFNIVRFSTDVDLFKPALVDVAKESLDEAGTFLTGLAARGGTDINLALEKALQMKSNEKRPYLIVFLTDGRPTIGTTDPQQILQNLSKSNQANIRVFVFGVGNDVNAPMLDQIADQTRSTTQYVAPDEDIEVKVSSFYDKVNAPVIAGLKLDFPEVEPYDVYPKQVPDLFKGSQLLVFGRFRKDGHIAVKLTGSVQGKEESFIFETTFPAEQAENDFIAKLWANRKVGYLLDEIRNHGENKELVDEVIALGKEHGIVTPYTSFLVAEDAVRVSQATGGGRPGLGGPRPEPLTDGSVARREGKSDEKGSRADRNGGPGEAAGAERAPSAPGKKHPAGEAEKLAAAVPEGAATEALRRTVEKAKEESRGFFSNRKEGADAVATSKAIWALKDKDIEDDSRVRQVVVGTTVVAGRTFRLVDAVWTDEAWKAENKPVQIKYLSDAYFKLFESHPDLKKVFALGKQILVVLKSGKAIQIGEEGKEDLSEKELKELLD